MCVGENGHVAIELMNECAVQSSEGACELDRTAGPCPHCIGEENSRNCNDFSLSPFSLSFRSAIQATLNIPSERAVSVIGLQAGTLPPFAAAGFSGDICNPFFIESATQRHLSVIVLQI